MYHHTTPSKNEWTKSISWEDTNVRVASHCCDETNYNYKVIAKAAATINPTVANNAPGDEAINGAAAAPELEVA